MEKTRSLSIPDDDTLGGPRANESPCSTRQAVRRALLHARAGWLAGAGAVLSTAAAADPFPAEFDLATLLPENGGDSTDGMVINGAYASDGLGQDVATADLNGDGIEDIVVSSGRLDGLDTGRTHVIFGRPLGEFPAVFEVQSLYPEFGGDGSAGFSIQSQLSDYTGESLAGVGDLNGDGVDDLALGGRFAQDIRRVGESYLVFGRDTDLVGPFPPVFFLRDLRPDPELGGDGSEGFVFSGVAPEDRMGYALGGAGDINGDGMDDLIVAAPDTTLQTASEGVVFTLFGRDTAADGLFPARLNSVELLPSAGGTGSEGFVTRGSGIGDRIGWSVGGGFDLNADGRDDVLIGSLNLTPDQSGGAIVLFGRTTDDPFPPRLDIASLLPPFGGDGTSGLFIDGIDPFDETGSALSPAGDVNGDGVDDVIIAADRASPGGRDLAGRAYVVFGRTGIDGPPFPSVLELSRLLPEQGGDGRFGFVVNGAAVEDLAGFAVAGGMDINGDGIDDLVMSALNGSPQGRDRAGQVFVVYGRDTASQGRFPAGFDLAQLFARNGGDGSEGFVINGDAELLQAGRRIAVGDVNGDGLGDVLITSLGATPDDNRPFAGRTFVVYGRSTED